MDTAQLLYQQGLAFHRQGLLEKAKLAYQQAVKFNPRHAPALHTLGVLASQANDPASGLQLIARALSVEPLNPVFLTNASNALLSLKRYDEALALCEQALSIKPDHFSALRNQGVALAALLRYPDAIDCFDQALQINPEFGEIYLLRASALCELKAYTEAVATADRLLALQPDFFEAHLCKAQTLTAAMRYGQACEALEAALVLQPQNALAWFLRGLNFEYDKKYTDAVFSYAKAVALDPQLPYASGTLLYAKMLCCDWSDLNTLCSTVSTQVTEKKLAIYPFGYQAVCDDEASLWVCAKTVAQDKYPIQASSFVHPAWPLHSKIRLGYLCGEFREQATSILMTEVWEHHDKDQFEIFAFDNGWDDASPRRARINQAFDHVIDISRLPDREAAELIHAHQIDILVNLNVFFGRHRNQVFSMRPSPVQVNYLGFPGTMGAPYMDYLIADATVIPPSSQVHYTEKVVYLPGCYQPNDTQRVISTRLFTRQELGLPLEGFVFCCFNNNYKITPTTFDVWMRILQQVPGSVLWLLQDTPESAANLQREAAQRGVDAHRLVFAPRMPNAEHLARHALADLFLDTWPYNAHTTASDALWAGLPLLTLQANTFPGRVASSLLKAVHCDDMVCATVDAYEAKAIHLATHPDALAHARQALVIGKASGTLYDTEHFTQNLEQAFSKMLDL
jgi:predicted O-linked N-acetylglucosamine transferase (SPINDLY family)